MTTRAPADAVVPAGADDDEAGTLTLDRRMKPRLRGWLHAVATPLVAAAGIVLVVLSDGTAAGWACVAYAVCAVVLFGTSATYHLGPWSPRTTVRLRRQDHANIYLMIAGSYTPLVVMGLGGRWQWLLVVVWAGALAGVLFKILWIDAPSWLSTVLYIALGWSVVGGIGEIFARNGAAVGTLVVVGGAAYTVGGVVHALRRPDPWPRVFGFHEVFHALTIVAWVCQYVAISLLAYR